jgi:hypothetical protein
MAEGFREAAITGPGGRSSVVSPHRVGDDAKLNVSRGVTCKSTFPAVFFRAKGGMKAGRSRLEPRSVGMQPWKATGKMQQSEGVRITGMRYMSYHLGLDSTVTPAAPAADIFPVNEGGSNVAYIAAAMASACRARAAPVAKYSKMNHGNEGIGTQLDEWNVAES